VSELWSVAVYCVVPEIATFYKCQNKARKELLDVQFFNAKYITIRLKRERE